MVILNACCSLSRVLFFILISESVNSVKTMWWKYVVVKIKDLLLTPLYHKHGGNHPLYMGSVGRERARKHMINLFKDLVPATVEAWQIQNLVGVADSLGTQGRVAVSPKEAF